ncbi:DUF397 domain-containing protein [Streptomyces sp. NPDC016640]|uniref:DUF397 domain-containing protein n=1 Tax=Streptomyces sp. NPDC016640 TaxID=3364969 RepID=UPI0037036BD4
MDTAPHGIPNPADAEWRSSTYSGGNDECLERAHHVPSFVPVRDSKAPDRDGDPLRP